MAKKTIQDICVKGKKCLVRVDFNVPLDKATGAITDENRIIGALPTIKYLMEEGAKVILCSHMGRPKGEFNMKYSLKPVAERLNALLGGKVAFASDVIGDSAKSLVAACRDGECVLLENLRFHKEEEENNKDFCKALSAFADIYVNDAFGTAHRAHASTAGIVQYGFVKDAVAGFLIEKELKILSGALDNPIRPFVAILGGAKVSDKIGVINNLLEKVDSLIIGGAMAYTFFKAMGYNVGSSRFEEDKIELAKELIAKAKAKNVNLLLPVDNIVADAFDNNANIKTVASDKIADGWMGLDIGEKSIKIFGETIRKAKTIIWNGPMGVFEMSNFAKGTSGIAQAMSEANGTTIIGGGDSAAAVATLGFADKMTHISTGGGASLEFLEGLVLPGCDCLNEKRIPIIAGNWKMNNTMAETKALLTELIPLVADTTTEVVVCVPYTAIATAGAMVKGTNIKLGAENVHWAEKGAFTGEISPAMLKELEVEYVIIGHSERRQFFGETDATVNKRIKAALANGLKPIVCVGELLAERESGKTEEVVSMQTIGAFDGIEASAFDKIVIAYEPVWAIGTGKTATSAEANETIGIIRRQVAGLYGDAIAQKVRIQYGGSMNAKNVKELMAMPEIDGGLIGGASLKAVDFTAVVKF